MEICCCNCCRIALNNATKQMRIIETQASFAISAYIRSLNVNEKFQQ